MTDHLLLRFRDLVPNIDSIEEHNRIAAESKRVFWGWWKKPLEAMPRTALLRLAEDLKERAPQKIYFIDSASLFLYRADLEAINVNFENPSVVSKNYSWMVPEYYRDKQLFAWFLIGPIEKIDEGIGFLRRFVWSTTNRTLRRDERRPSNKTALHESLIGERVTETDFLDSNVSLWFITPIEEAEIRSRPNLVDSISSVPWKIKGRYIIHLSDLHFGENHAFRNHLASKKGPRIAKESLADVLLQDFELLNLDDSNVALVLITGDLTWQSNVHEFANALAFIQTLQRSLDLHPSQVVVVPGNHDIEWMEGNEDLNEDAELNYRNFCRELYGTRPEDSFLRIHRFEIQGHDVSVIALNSCRLESKANAGLGYVGREQLREMTELLKLYAKDDLKFALVHHHLLPVNYMEDIPWNEKKVSLTLDADDVIRSLISARVRIVLHGHQHQPYLSEIRRIIEGYVNFFDRNQASKLDGTIAVLGGGSIGVDRSHINFVGRNTYNVLELTSRSSGQSQAIQIRTRMQSPVGPGFQDYQVVSIEF